MNSKYFLKSPWGKRLIDEINVTGLNKLPYHVPSVPYETEEEALICDCRQSSDYIPLSGTWKFLYSKSILEVPDGFENDNGDSWDEIPVPSCWQLYGYGAPKYINVGYAFLEKGEEQNPPFTPEEKNSAGIYKRSFTVPESFSNKRIILSIGAASSSASVFINGSFVGYSENSKTAAEFDITDFIYRDKTNDLSILVTEFSSGSWLEDQDMFRLSGITRDVGLYAVCDLHLYDFYAYSVFSEDFSHASLIVESKIINLSKNRFGKKTVEMKVLDPSGNLVAEASGENGNLSFRFEEKVPFALAADIKGGTVATAYLKAEIDFPHLWCAEKPELYTVILKLKTDSGEVSEFHSFRHGFRKIEMCCGELLINGKAIKLKGVNRHETHPKKGYVVSREDCERDIIMMKQNNVNAVRASHYPCDSYFYDLCDKYGLYVMDEANMESHGISYRKNILPGNDHRWLPAVMDRIGAMLNSDKNHPSVIIWSLGNEIGFGETVAIAAAFCKTYDPTRLIHKRQMNSVADMDSETYPSVEVMIQHAKSNPERMFITNEYAHAMGNAAGSLCDYWDAIYSHRSLGGAFVWEWCDHSIIKKNERGDEYYGYGGDFGETKHDENFCCDGLITPDRRNTPKLAELKKVHEFIVATDFDAKNAKLCIHNRHFHTDLSAYFIEYSILKRGHKIYSGTVDCPPILPGESKDVILALPNEAKNGEYILDVSFRYKEAQSFCEAGFEVAFAQFKLGKDKKIANISTESLPSITVEETEEKISLFGKGFTLKVEKPSGCITAKYDDIIARDVNAPCFFRALTDNDKRKVNYDKNDKNTPTDWESAGLFNIKTTLCNASVIERRDGVVRLALNLISCGIPDAGFRTQSTVTVFGDGRILFDNSVEPFGTLPSLIRIGASTKLPSEYSNVLWYGFGPHETYPDRAASGRLGIYKEKVDEPLKNYVMPQECGAKMNTSFMTLTNENGDGIGFSGALPYTMSALPYTAEELDKMNHLYKSSHSDKVVFTVDFAQCGVGNRSCGPDTLPQYRIQPIPVRYAYTMMPIEKNLEPPKIIYPESILPPLKAMTSESYVKDADDEYRDPSDEDVRRKSGFAV